MPASRRWSAGRHDACVGGRVRYALATLLVVSMLAPAARARAQCTSVASSCVTCHETQGLRPVLQSAQPWHVDHGFGDLCAACHGGDPAASTADEAHVGLRRPLSEPAVSCAGCHADDAAARAERYAAAMTASSPSTTRPPPAPPPTASGNPTAERVLAVIAAALAVALYFALRRTRSTVGRAARVRLRDALWSPYLAGALLGLVVAFSELVCGRPVAVSGAFDKLAAYLGRWFFPTTPYYGQIMSPGITWQVWLIIGLLAGSFTSSKLSGEARLRWLPDTQWQARFGSSRALRLVIAFGGAVLVQVGAGIAGGCTSGLAISGGAALSPAAFLFMAGMFAGGIPAAWLTYRGKGD